MNGVKRVYATRFLGAYPVELEAPSHQRISKIKLLYQYHRQEYQCGIQKKSLTDNLTRRGADFLLASIVTHYLLVLNSSRPLTNEVNRAVSTHTKGLLWKRLQQRFVIYYVKVGEEIPTSVRVLLGVAIIRWKIEGDRILRPQGASCCEVPSVYIHCSRVKILLREILRTTT